MDIIDYYKNVNEKKSHGHHCWKICHEHFKKLKEDSKEGGDELARLYLTSYLSLLVGVYKSCLGTE